MKTNMMQTKHYPGSLLVLLFAVLFLIVSQPVAAAKGTSGFDHFSTGFPLTGKHEFIDCSSCHVNGRFKGTPTSCGQCHNNIMAPGKNANHITSNDYCDDCHTVNSWRDAHFDHSTVVGACSTCHNSNIALGKSPSHIQSTQACDDCHNTISFTHVGRVDHDAVIGTCTSCHNGLTATGKPVSHPTTNDQCDACHDTRSWHAVRFDHANITQPCSSCHNGSTAPGKPPTHVTTSAECDACHTSTSTWLGASFDHNNVTGQCSSCHNGSPIIGKSASHFVTTLDCDRCHDTKYWSPQIPFRHDSANYPGDHNTGVTCSDCHTGNNQVIAWPYPYKPDCAGCHANVYNSGETASHHKNTPLADLADCAGTCHFDGTKSGVHRVSASRWGD
jgi:hypothetical protein